MSHPLPEMLTQAMEKIRGMTDASTIIGEPISVPGDITIIPVSKVSYGFGGGGSDFAAKSASGKNNFGGGVGAGISITPISFLIVSDGNVRMLPIAQAPSTAVDRILEMAPDIMEKISDLFPKKEKTTEEEIV